MENRNWKSISIMLALAVTTAVPVFATERPEARDDLHGNYNFLLEVAGTPAGQFNSVSGLSVETEVIEYREGGDDNVVRKLPGRLKYENITLKRGYVPNPVLREWMWTNLDPDGMVDRRDGALELQDRAGNMLVRYEFFDAWPCKWSGATPEDDSDAAFVEEIVICVEYFREIPPPAD